MRGRWHRQAKRAFAARPLVAEVRPRSGAGRQGTAKLLDSLGYALQHLGDHDLAIACYQRALALSREHGDRHLEASELDHLGDVYRAQGRPEAAWRLALDILDQLAQPGASQILIKIRDLGET